MRLTDLTTVCPKTRQYRKAVTLQENLIKRWEYHYKNSKSELNFSHQARFESLNQHLTDQIARLDRDELISHPALGQVLAKPVKALMSWVYEGLPEPGAAQHDDVTASLVELMNNKGRSARAAAHKFHLAAEIAHRTTEGWYLIFNTLTVAPGHYYQVFSPKSMEFKNYVRSVQRAVNQAETGSRNLSAECKQRSGTNHTYFAVVEEGAKNGRLHIHVLHFVRTLPFGSNDPNKGKLRPTNREIRSVKSLWQHGHSLPIAVRYSPLDAYGKSGWRWPYDLKTDNALQIRSPLALSSYMSKYITKSYTCPKRAKLLWRVKKSHKLGLKTLQELTSQLTPPAQIYLAANDTIKLTFNNTRIPPTLLRQMALKSYLNRLSTQNLSSSTGLLDIAKNVTPRPSLLHSFRGSTTTTQLSSLQNITTLLTSGLLREATFKGLWQEIKEAAIRVDNKYYPRSNQSYGTTSTADYFTNAVSVTRKVSAA